MTRYLATRGADTNKTFTDVLLNGLASDGGLFIPEKWPTLSREDISHLGGVPYADIAYKVTEGFIGDSIDKTTYKNILRDVYQNEFNHSCVAPLVQIGPNAWVLELFHGPTLAFKDYALQLLGRLFDHVLEQRGERVTIVGATSGRSEEHTSELQSR